MELLLMLSVVMLLLTKMSLSVVKYSNIHVKVYENSSHWGLRIPGPLLHANLLPVKGTWIWWKYAHFCRNLQTNNSKKIGNVRWTFSFKNLFFDKIIFGSSCAGVKRVRHCRTVELASYWPYSKCWVSILSEIFSAKILVWYGGGGGDEFST